MKNEANLHTAIIGAGPAGLFAAQKISSLGYGAALFNHDIKPGGLVEYGIFLEKHKIKNGFRTQFKQILGLENVEYFGNVTVGRNGNIQISDLFNWGFSAVLVTCGAQGTKYINLPGEKLRGVFHAKDLVYHYNQLPPFSIQHFPIGKKVAIVGAGNVMTDIAHYLINYRDVEEITVIIRRGPAEVKFDQKELVSIIPYLDVEAFKAEIKRVSPIMLAIGQDPEAAEHRILVALEKACPREHATRIVFRFLSSPKEIIADQKGGVAAVKIEANTLELAGENVNAHGLGQFSDLTVDNVIFAIGDKVNDDLGLPMERGEICKARQPKFQVEEITFEVGDPQNGEPLPGIFYAGWSRNPSTGLAGIARRDGVFAATAIGNYLSSKGIIDPVDQMDIKERLAAKEINYVTKEKLQLLEAEEKKQAEAKGLEEFKFSTNEEMLKAMGMLTVK